MNEPNREGTVLVPVWTLLRDPWFERLVAASRKRRKGQLSSEQTHRKTKSARAFDSPHRPHLLLLSVSSQVAALSDNSTHEIPTSRNHGVDRRIHSKEGSLGFERYGLVITVLLAVWCRMQIIAVGSLIALVLV